MLKIPLLAFFELVMPSRIKAGIMMAARTCHGTNNCTSKGSFYTNHGSFTIDTNNGCRSISAPAMTELCMDWEGNRMHVRFTHYSDRRCMVKGAEICEGCDQDRTWWCCLAAWEEVDCWW
jgi:hypothetical protein